MKHLSAIQLTLFFLATAVTVFSQSVAASEEMVTRFIPIKLLESFCKDINMGPNALNPDDRFLMLASKSLLREKRRAEPGAYLQELGQFLKDDDFDDYSFELSMERLRRQLEEMEEYAEKHRASYETEELIESCRDLFESMEQAVHDINTYIYRGFFFDGLMLKMIKSNVLAVALQTPLFEEDTDPEEYKRLFLKLYCDIFLIEYQYEFWGKVLDYNDTEFTLRVAQTKHTLAPLKLTTSDDPNWEVCSYNTEDTDALQMEREILSFKNMTMGENSSRQQSIL